MATPKDLKFSKSDEWLKIEDGTATIGISDFAQNQLSDIVYVEYEVDIDDTFEKDAAIATIESVKAAADVHAPISGTVTEVNEDLIDNPEKLNEDPYNNWLIKIAVKDASEADSLLSAGDYDKFCEERGH